MKPDFRSPEFIADPYPAYARLREQAPIFPMAPKTWLATRYRDVDPDRFSLDRPENTAKALAFGGGAHYCLGARLARIELETALETLFRRLPGLRIEHLDRLQWKPTFTIRGLESLPARWR